MSEQKRKRILSGMRPSGKLHLGNYFGALKNWVDLQDNFECFLCNIHIRVDRDWLSLQNRILIFKVSTYSNAL